MTTQRSAISVSRRAALAGLGAGSLGFALATGGIRSAAQDATPTPVETTSNVVFGEVDGQQLLLDIAAPPVGAAARPAVVLFHGGALMFGDKEGIADLATHLAQAGYVAFSIGYRLFSEAGSNPWPAQLDDAQRSVRWIRANATTYGVDPERVASFGHSSGGQLAAFLGVRDTRDNSDTSLAGFSSRVSCVVDIAGGMDMTIPSPDRDNATYTTILGGTAGTPPDDAAYRDFSPITFVDEQTVPFAILHGLADTNSPIEQSRRMVDALHTAGVEVFAAEFAGQSHMSIGDWAVIGPFTLAFLDRQLGA